MRRPFRFWMTGCAAVVMVGLGGIGGGSRDSAAQETVLRQSSRYGLGETVQRLHDRAAGHGLWVFARFDSGLWAPHAGVGSVIVFRTAAGGTPVLMGGPADGPRLPLSVQVHLSADGRTEVVSSINDWELPPEMAHELEALPLLIADAVA